MAFLSCTRLVWDPEFLRYKGFVCRRDSPHLQIPSYKVRVPQVESLRPASFGQDLAALSLPFASGTHRSGPQGTFTP